MFGYGGGGVGGEDKGGKEELGDGVVVLMDIGSVPDRGSMRFMICRHSVRNVSIAFAGMWSVTF